MTSKSPRSLVERALRRYRNLALNHRRGGLAEDYELAQRALLALDNLVEVRQLGLLDENRRPGTPAEVRIRLTKGMSDGNTIYAIPITQWSSSSSHD